MNHLGNEENCIFCDQGVKEGDQLNDIGSRWTLKDEEDKEKKRPIDTIIDQAKKLHMENFVTILERNKLSKIKTYIHKTCRTTLRNNLRKRLSSSTDQDANKRQRAHCDYCNFDFKTRCFYCGNLCIFDPKHPDCKNFEEVTTKLTKIHSVTLAICKTCDDLVAKTLERRLLNVSNLVAAEARYHVPLKSCPKVREERSPNINTKIHVI